MSVPFILSLAPLSSTITANQANHRFPLMSSSHQHQSRPKHHHAPLSSGRQHPLPTALPFCAAANSRSETSMSEAPPQTRTDDHQARKTSPPLATSSLSNAIRSSWRQLHITATPHNTEGCTSPPQRHHRRDARPPRPVCIRSLPRRHAVQSPSPSSTSNTSPRCRQ